MSEFKEDSYTSHYARYKNKFYTAIRDFKINRDILTKELIKEVVV
jgi:hypothetical protein